MTTTTERRAGQRWKWRTGTVHVLRERIAAVSGYLGEWWSTDEKDVFCSFINGTDGWELLADAPAVAPVAADRTRPPTGYAECTKKCGRWTNIGACWTCGGEADWNPHSRFPDWTPPLAAQPAETKRTLAKSIETCCQSDGCCASVDAECGKCGLRACWLHAGDDHACKPAPQPKPAKGPKTNCLLCGDMGCAHCEPEHGLPCEGIPAIPAEQVCFDCDLSPATARYIYTGLRMICDDCYLNREKHIGDDQSGTPYTGPERLERPKLAHSSMWADEAEDVR